MSRRLAALPLLLCIALLGACGFHLRGTGDIVVAEAWRSMYLVTNNPNSEFSRDVLSHFAAYGVHWEPERKDANYVVELGQDQFSQRNLSLNAAARAAEFELTMYSDFSVRDQQGDIVMPSTRATVLRQMENDPQNPVGKAEEIRILKSEMRTELAQQILRRIAFFAASREG